MRKESVALARPYSVALLAHGSMRYDMMYSDGILCYTLQGLIRILDVHGASETEAVIDISKLMAKLPAYVPNTDIDNSGQIFSHQNGILTMRLGPGLVDGGGNLLMVVIDVRRDFVATPERLSRKIMILREPLPWLPQHVITDGRYLVCVDIPRVVSEWTLKCYDLSKMGASDTNAPTSIIALNEFLPRGDECRFRLLDGLLYVICDDQDVEFDRERHDHERKLYYNCCRFPINCPITEKPEDFLDDQYTPLPAGLEAFAFYRGHGHYFWKQSCYDLVKDEQTGELFIVESPSFIGPPESDTPYRRLNFPKSPEHTVRSWETKISEIVQIVDVDDYKYDNSQFGKLTQETRIYVQPSQCILDISYEDLKDPEEGSDEDHKQRLLHLYACSTKRGIWRFPTPSAPPELREFLTKPRGVFGIYAKADERSLIVILVDLESDDGTGMTDCQLVLVNFDSGINFPGLKDLASDNLSDKVFKNGEIDVTSAILSENVRQSQVELLHLNEKAGGKAEAPDACKAQADSWFSTSPALHTIIRQGFRFPPKTTAE